MPARSAVRPRVCTPEASPGGDRRLGSDFTVGPGFVSGGVSIGVFTPTLDPLYKRQASEHACLILEYGCAADRFHFGAIDSFPTRGKRQDGGRRFIRPGSLAGGRPGQLLRGG